MKYKKPCNHCDGRGFTYVNYPYYSPEIRKKAKELRKKKMTLRAIAEVLGLNHPQTVKNLLK